MQKETSGGRSSASKTPISSTTFIDLRAGNPPVTLVWRNTNGR